MFRRTLPIQLFITAGLGFGASCAQDSPAGTAEQRDVGQVILASGSTVSMVPAAADLVGDASVVLRAAAPEPSMSVTTGRAPSGPISITVQNLPANVRLEVTNIIERTADTSPGCPDDTAGQLLCTDNPDPRCVAPAAQQDEVDPNQRTITWSQPACLQTNFRFSSPAAAEAWSVGVAGATASLDGVRRALEVLADERPDFAVLLGDNSEGSSLRQLRALAATIARADFPVFVLPGERETDPNSRARFREVFGPYDYQYGFRGVRFITLYSAGGLVGSTRLVQLESTLRRFTDQPVVILTHTPPIDPIGERNDGFLSEIEGARAVSLMSDLGADHLVAGHIRDVHERDLASLKMHITSATSSRAEVLLLRVDAQGAISTETIPLD